MRNILIAITACGMTGVASAAILLPSQVTATASSEALAAENVVNLDGLSGPAGSEVHSTATDGLWLSVSTDNTRQIKFTFDDIYALDTMKVWNYNQSGLANRGLRHALIETSLDNTNWTEFDDDHEFAIASGNSNQPVTDVIDMTGVTARYVRLTALPITAGSDSGSWGDIDQVGLSEVQFIIVPEPSSLAIVGLGSLLWMRRRTT